MKIPKRTTQKWKRLKSDGDIEILVALTKRSQPIVSKAISQGIATIEVFNAINSFYAEREKQITA